MYQRRIVVSYWSTDIFYIMSIVNKLTDICDTTLLVHCIQVLNIQFNKLKTSTNQSFLYYLVGLETLTLNCYQVFEDRFTLLPNHFHTNEALGGLYLTLCNMLDTLKEHVHRLGLVYELVLIGCLTHLHQSVFTKIQVCDSIYTVNLYNNNISR